MAVTIRVQPISRDVALLVRDLQGPQQSQLIADFARQLIDEAKETNRTALGRVPPFETFVDGRRGAPLETVRPRGGVIVVEFELVTDVLRYIGEQLVLHSPFLSGRYQRSHILLADGIEIDPDAALTRLADEYVFINKVPYARKIERGSSSEAPDGVYQAVTTLARRRFSNIARITFTYRGLVGGLPVGGRAGNRSEHRQPAIVVSLGARR